jgi:D-apionolactonase
LAAGEGRTAGLDAFGLSALVDEGALRRITFDGHEIVRLIDYPIRDADWGTVPTVTEGQQVSPGGESFLRRFRTADGTIEGRFEALVAPAGTGVRILADLVLTATRDAVVNRAGFIVLHPLDGVAGELLTVRHSDGRIEELRFPARISPGQPVLDIASLAHRVGAVDVSMAFDGEVFEMEDQRNWTDASFKTYCRALALPRPYELRASEKVRQRITVTLTQTAARTLPAATGTQSAAVTMPEVLLAHERAITGPPHPQVSSIAPQGVLLRMNLGTDELETWPACPITLELATGPDAAPDLRAAAEAVSASGLDVKRVVALPGGYLRSQQPEGPWPDGWSPMDLVPMVRDAFPGAEVGGGMLTNFTEFNRCPPDPKRIDFATFGTTAIVHAADDLSVIETLEAIPQVIESARALSGDRPLRLGLMSIGMRSNPYGADVIPNPDGQRLPMAMDDPRQRTSFAAAFAIAVAAACARGGVASFAPAMTGGPLGMGDEDEPWPIWHAVAALAALAKVDVAVEGGPASGLVVIRGRGRREIGGVAANLGPSDAPLDSPAVLIPDRAAWTWIDALGAAGPLTLPPMTAAILTGGRA